MGPVRTYGDALALVTVTGPPRSAGGARVDSARGAGGARVRAISSLAAATGRPVRVLRVVTGAPAPGPVPDGVLRIGEDVGWAAAVNRAIASLDAGVGLVAVADPEVEFGAGALDALLDAAAATPRAGLLGPLVRDPSGAVRSSAGPVPARRDVLRGRLPAGPAAGPTGWLSGACVLVRRSAWDSVDGLDPRHPGGVRGRPDPADVDLGDRLGRAGWRVVGVPAAEVTLHADQGQGILEPYDRGLRRYLGDRHPAPVRVLAALLRRSTAER